MDVSIVVATFGKLTWLSLAVERAVASAERQGVPVIVVHGLTLSEARNAGLAQVKTRDVVHLDADDELAPGYCETLTSADGQLRVPAVQYVQPDGRRPPPYIPCVAGHTHDCTADCLEHGNWCVVGTMCPTDLLRDVGGWREWPVYEDWDLFLRCWRAGATVHRVPDATYIAYVNRQSRNRLPPMNAKNNVHHAIVAANR